MALFGPAREFTVQGTDFRIALESTHRTDYGSVYTPKLQENQGDKISPNWVTVSEYETIWKDIPEQMTAKLYTGGMIRAFNRYLVTRFPPESFTGEVPDMISEVSQAVFQFTNDVFQLTETVVWDGELKLT
jgi:hypothetical protein